MKELEKGDFFGKATAGPSVSGRVEGKKQRGFFTLGTF